jgi:hypothetical protein
MTERTLRGGAPLPEDYPLGLEDLHGDVEALPPEKLDALAAYYGHAEPEGEPPPEDAEYI